MWRHIPGITELRERRLEDLRVEVSWLRGKSLSRSPAPHLELRTALKRTKLLSHDSHTDQAPGVRLEPQEVAAIVTMLKSTRHSGTPHFSHSRGGRSPQVDHKFQASLGHTVAK